MHIAIVGGRGLIGDAARRQLEADGNDVTVVTHSAEASQRPGYRFGDLLHGEGLASAVAGAEVVVQSANFPSYPFEKKRAGQTFMAYDGIGTERLVAAAESAGVRRFVFVAGAGCRTESDRPYWRALRRGEQAVLESKMEGICIEPTLVFGPRDRGLNRILAFTRRTRTVPMLGPGEELHQPIFVEDLARLISQSVHESAPQGALAIGGPERLTMRDLVRRALEILDLRARFVFVPIPLARFGAGILERLPGEPLSRSGIDFALEDFIADFDPVLSSFQLELTSLDAGLRSYLSPA